MRLKAHGGMKARTRGTKTNVELIEEDKEDKEVITDYSIFVPVFSFGYPCRFRYISTYSLKWIHAAPVNLLLSCTIPNLFSLKP